MIRRLLPCLILLVVGTAWGLTFSLAKLAADAGGTPFGIAFWQALTGGILLLAYSIIRRRKWRLHPQHLILLPAIAITGVVFPNAIFYAAAKHIQPGILAIATALVPMITYAIATMLGREKALPMKLLGVTAGFAGVMLIVLPESSLPHQGDAFWVFLACIGATSYAIQNIVLDSNKSKDLGPIRLASGMNLTAALILLPLTAITDQFFMPSAAFGMLERSLLALSLVSVAAYATFFWIINIAGPVFASQVGYIVTVTGVFWGVIIFADTYPGMVWLALAIMLAGLGLVTPRREKTQPPIPATTAPAATGLAAAAKPHTKPEKKT